MPTVFISPTPPRARKRPRPRKTTTCRLETVKTTRRAFNSLLATTLLTSILPNPTRAVPLLDEDLDIDSAPSEEKERGLEQTRPIEERYGITDGHTAATYADYLDAIRVEDTDISHTASIYLNRLGVVGFVAGFSAIAQSISERESLRTKLPSEYDPDILARYFTIRPDKLLRRFTLFAREFAAIGALFAKNVIQDRIQEARGAQVSERDARVRAERDDVLARELRASITRLGPAVIKLGQAAATRPDLFPAPVVRELQTLQDNVLSSFPTAEAYELIELELGARPGKLFENMSEEPVAGASLGMVFKAEVDGMPVAVKIQRPEVAEQIALDCYIVRWMAGVATVLLRSRTDLRYAVDEYACRLFEELDYLNELRNMRKFRELYGDMPGIYLPKAFPEYCSRRVLVSEWVDGYKLIDEEAKVREEDVQLVETGIRFALTQLLDKGFLHADMHNGNMLRTKSGYLAYIDFGLVSEVPASVRESIVCALMHLIHGEYTLLAESFAGVAIMGVDDIEMELPILSSALREAFEPDPDMLAANREKGVDRFEQFTMVGIVEKLLVLGSRFPFIFNDYFLNNFRCLGMLEGLAINADPDFSILSVVYPYVVKKIMMDPRPRYRRALDSLVIDSYGRIRWSRMEKLLQDVQGGFATGGTLVRKWPDVDAEWLRKDVGGDSAALVMRFLTSDSGRFMRRYVMQQYISKVEKGFEDGVNGVFGIEDVMMTTTTRMDALHRIASRSTEREVSDDEALERTREYFRKAPFTKRCRLLLRLAPGFVGPVARAFVGMVAYAAGMLLRRVFVKAAGGQGGVAKDRGDGGYVAESGMGGEWTAFDSSLLRRTRRNGVSKLE